MSVVVVVVGLGGTLECGGDPRMGGGTPRMGGGDPRMGGVPLEWEGDP